MLRNLAAAALAVALSSTATAQVAILQIQVVEGEGAVHAPGSRSTRSLTVQITDEIGRPVSAAAVSFHLPDEGPSATFPNGLRTDVVTTDERGRASARSLRWNRLAGPFQIRIVASKEQARAGVISFQYITGRENPAARAAASGEQRHTPKVSRHHGLWVALGVLAGGAAAAGALTTLRGTAAGSRPATAPVSPAVTIGPPSVTVAKP